MSQQAQPVTWITWLLLLSVASWHLAPALALAPPVLLLWWLFLKYRVKGMNGDCLGAGVEFTETLLPCAAVAFYSFTVA